MDEHELGGNSLDGLSAPQRRAQAFLSLRLAGLSSEGALPEDYWTARMAEYRQRLGSLAEDLATLGDTSDTSSTS